MNDDKWKAMQRECEEKKEDTLKRISELLELTMDYFDCMWWDSGYTIVTVAYLDGTETKISIVGDSPQAIVQDVFQHIEYR